VYTPENAKLLLPPGQSQEISQWIRRVAVPPEGTPGDRCFIAAGINSTYNVRTQKSGITGERIMVGLFLTLLAVLLLICFAFYFSDHPSERGGHSDALFFLSRRNSKKDSH
jgi:hypothetical protein